MTQRFFITSSGTGIGKTLVTAVLCHQLRTLGRSVTALKPVISGWEGHGENSDTAEILRSLGQPLNSATIEAISPWRFHAPLSPDMAARLEGRCIDFYALARFCSAPVDTDYLLIEGVGGVMVPLTEEQTVRDLIEVLRIPSILVTGSYLGSLSHTLTALEALRACDIKVRGLVISESENSGVSLSETEKTLHNFVDCPMMVLPRVPQGNTPVWAQLPDITSLVTG